MLTRELLAFTVREGRVRPRFVDPAAPAVRALAESLLEVANAAPGCRWGDIDSDLSAIVLQDPKPKIGRGLAKLLQDRLTVAEPGEEPAARRAHAFAVAMDELAKLSPDAPFSTYEAALQERLGPLEPLRAGLHGDLPAERLVVEFEPIDAQALLDRYNLALAQGLVLYARRLELRLGPAGRPEVRRLLRWLRFCRLVAEVTATAEGCAIGVEGPAAIFDGAKRYGFELARFLTGVPRLDRWQLSAEVKMPNRPSARLELDETSPLVSPIGGAPGHVPEELSQAFDRLDRPGWSIDPSPPPRITGARGLAVPDFALVPESGPPVVVELFHRWHRGPLLARLEELIEQPDPELFLGVDRALARDPELLAQLEAHPQVFLFRGFPTVRTLRRLTER